MILGTYENRHINNFDEAKTLIEKLEETIQYNVVDKRDIQAGEVIDCPIMPECFETAPVATIGTVGSDVHFMRLDGSKSFKIKKDLNDQMREAMTESRLVLGYKDENGEFEPQPLALNSLPSLVNQCIGGKSTVLCQTEDKNASKQMRTEVKVAILNEFLSLRNDKCKIYKCDGMVRYVAGDTYVYLPISELLNALEKEIKDTYNSATFVSADISHQYVEVLYTLNDDVLRDEIANILGMAGITEKYEPAILFTTSNTGDCGANLHPILLGNGNKFLVIEEPENMEHTGTASTERFTNNVKGLMALFKTTPERLESLSQISLKHPANAYRNVALKSNIPLAAFQDQADDFEATFGNLATALDLYVELSNALYAYADAKGMDVLRRTKILNSLSQKFLSIDRLTECDVDVDFTKAS